MTQIISTIKTHINTALGQHLTTNETIAIGVSGGGDSMALLVAVHIYNAENNLNLNIVALTVDHKLREASATEAEQVAKWCATLGIRHQVLAWEFDLKPSSAIQEKARKARYELMGEYCNKNDINKLFLAHNLEDNAETLLMRLKRGAGLRGLSAITEISQRRFGDGFVFAVIRPLLAINRADLRSYLNHFGQKWFDDSSNLDVAFERVRLRQFLTENDWLKNESLALSAARLAQANEAVEFYVDEFWQTNIKLLSFGIAKLSFEPFLAQPIEIQLRLLARLIWTIGGQDNPPRWQKIENLQNQITDASAKLQFCLGNCMVVLKKNELWFGYEAREPAPKSENKLAANQQILWQNRLRVVNNTHRGVVIANLQLNKRLKIQLTELNDGLKNCPDSILKTMPIILAADGELLHPNVKPIEGLNIGLKMQT